jgi:hypothetical protein
VGGVSAAEARKRDQKLWLEFFSKPCACMRTSPLPKTYGWGLHFNAEGKVAVVPVGSKEYQRLKNDPSSSFAPCKANGAEPPEG